MQPYSKKRIKPEDVMSFPWDWEARKDKKKTAPERSTVERMRKVAEKTMHSPPPAVET